MPRLIHIITIDDTLDIIDCLFSAFTDDYAWLFHYVISCYAFSLLIFSFQYYFHSYFCYYYFISLFLFFLHFFIDYIDITPLIALIYFRWLLSPLFLFDYISDYRVFFSHWSWLSLFTTLLFILMIIDADIDIIKDIGFIIDIYWQPLLLFSWCISSPLIASMHWLSFSLFLIHWYYYIYCHYSFDTTFHYWHMFIIIAITFEYDTLYW